MKIAILVPTEEYLSFAGTRIRYLRILEHLKASGAQIEFHDIHGFDAISIDCDICIISKVHDARAILAGAILSARGRLVGVDLFDDYFSDPDDSRFARFQLWLMQMVPVCDFALCSTRRMAEVVAGYRSELAVHVMNDPAPAFDRRKLEESLTGKLAKVRETGTIKVIWFGVGNNRMFPVGLDDLSSHADDLARLTATGLVVELTVVTNADALDTDGLAKISRCPVPAQLLEWTPEVERAALESAFLAFLPVNSQAFSRAKSLNRAVTALTSGCQVLTAGYPLYAPLAPLIYDRAADLLANLERGSMLLSHEQLPVLDERLAEMGSAEVEAARLLSFLKALPAPAAEQLPLIVVHGHLTRPDAHTLVRSAGGLSVASPYCSANLDFDVRFRGRGTNLEMRIAPWAVSRLGSPRPSCSPGLMRREESWLARLGGKIGLGSERRSWMDRPLAFQAASYWATITEMRTQLRSMFGPSRIILSELSSVHIGDPRRLSDVE